MVVADASVPGKTTTRQRIAVPLRRAWATLCTGANLEGSSTHERLKSANSGSLPSAMGRIGGAWLLTKNMLSVTISCHTRCNVTTVRLDSVMVLKLSSRVVLGSAWRAAAVDAAEEPVDVLALSPREGVDSLTSVIRLDCRVAVVRQGEGLTQNSSFHFAVAQGGLLTDASRWILVTSSLGSLWLLAIVQRLAVSNHVLAGPVGPFAGQLVTSLIHSCNNWVHRRGARLHFSNVFVMNFCDLVSCHRAEGSVLISLDPELLVVHPVVLHCSNCGGTRGSSTAKLLLAAAFSVRPASLHFVRGVCHGARAVLL